VGDRSVEAVVPGRCRGGEQFDLHSIEAA
jgi:hypothetical protein